VYDTRAELVEDLSAYERSYGPRGDWGPLTGPEARVARADQYGSSALHAFARWDDPSLPVMEGAPRDGWYHIRRDRLVDYAERLLVGDDAGAQALLECWQRHGDPDE
jgi:hypothetical protein